ncbi:phosphate/phosphite/phosphonate ABC transporter substrate-binding protein [Paenibacillus hunanensis]|uniref:Phosphonate transport system substrate-binding protein n=1 Tax=Paenibacillus hunanensis TaxID=539262 RepID=A0ABU1J106_9BACL|nr:phosphate/phosphite/phosphonate ABC transporter substrate-binding protein [Paenibacillus hunanensis]MCL9663008.1 phosphate/phosphite/phosphonate ABC transporter substrate-binding protein [Paenibacillus hunanensis]MDR6245174.1 phosphonate transport system substrate-binding protein [Paenibacillus hunanensis]WPP39977.1 phosphate/phosphite/phosphonate ABC transporter substrate-binding protein [Paenibacillus hunanensis]GGJ20912.1 phosphonate ABC transporter substrate-binding protein [Paenibacillu
MFKKVLAIGMTLAFAVGLTACGGNPSTSASSGTAASTAYVPTELKVQFVPSQNAETLEAKAKPLEKLLGDKLGIPVSVSVSPDYNTIVEAMASRQVDVGFLPPNAYVLAHDNRKAADLLLQAQRYGVNDETGQPTTEKVNYYKSMIIVKKDSPIKSLTDLKGKKIGWQDVTSSAGYVFPAAELKKAGIDPDTDVQGVTIKGHDAAVMALLNGQVDAVAVFQDARNTVKKDVPTVFDQTRVIHFTAPIPNDTISVRSDMDQTWRDKISQAFIDIGNDPEGQKIIEDIYTHVGYEKGDDKNFDPVREYAKEVGQAQ